MHTPGPLTFNRREIGDKSILMEIPGDGWHRLSCEVCCDDCDVETAVHNAKLLAASYTSYDRHCGPRAIELAEGDLLGELIQFVRKVSTPLDCGCKPCTGDCMSETSMRIAIECMAEDAAALLAKLPEQP